MLQNVSFVSIAGNRMPLHILTRARTLAIDSLRWSVFSVKLIDLSFTLEHFLLLQVYSENISTVKTTTPAEYSSEHSLSSL